MCAALDGITCINFIKYSFYYIYIFWAKFKFSILRVIFFVFCVFNVIYQKIEVKLFGYSCGLKLNNPPVPYTLTWKIIDRGRVFNPVTRKCRLCLKEKWHILFNPDASSLNSRTEIFNRCVHKRSFTLLYAHL